MTNAEKIRLTGNKADEKVYHRHTGYPGGLKTVAAKDLQAKYPERVIEAAVRGMLPKTKLGRKQFKKLKVYRGAKHPHEAQQPRPLKIVAARRRRSKPEDDLAAVDIQHRATGVARRRWRASASFPGTGAITVNKRSLDDYFPNNVLKMVIKQPLLSTETAEKFDIHVTVAGGGPDGPGRRDPPRHLARADRLQRSSCARSSRRKAS